MRKRARASHNSQKIVARITYKNMGVDLENLKVKCYSGYTYAQRPLSFTWQGSEYEVENIEKEWQGPRERWFLVRTGDNKCFQLCYNEAQDEWSITEPAKEQQNDKENS